MEIKLTEKQNLILSKLISLNVELQREVERNGIRQNELVDVILEFNKIDIKDVTQVNLEGGILNLILKEKE